MTTKQRGVLYDRDAPAMKTPRGRRLEPVAAWRNDKIAPLPERAGGLVAVGWLGVGCRSHLVRLSGVADCSASTRKVFSVVMLNYSCSLNTVVAWLAWLLAVVVAALYVFVNPRLGVLVVLFTASGATLHVRGFVHAMERREVEAFELGRKSMHSVR